MDTASKAVRHTAFLIGALASLAAPAWAQTLSTNLSGLTLSALPGGAQQQTFLVTNSSTTAVPFNLSIRYPTGVPAGWLSISGLTTYFPTLDNSATVSVTGSAAGLPTGSYLGYVVIRPQGNGQAEIDFPVTFTVGTSGGTGTLSATPSSLSLNYTTNGAFPSQTVTLASSNGAPTYVAAATSTEGWLLVDNGASVSGIPVSNGVTLSAGTAAAGLGTGTYAGYVMVTASDGSTAAINATLIVNGGAASGIGISPNPVPTFSALVGSTTPQQATFMVAGGTSVTPSVTDTGACGNSWLQVSPTTATSTPVNVAVTVNPTGLPAGICLGSITLTTNPGSLTQVVGVALIVGGANTQATSLLVAPAALSFAAQAGQSAAQSPQYLLVGGGATFTISVSTSSGGNWLFASAVNADTIGVSVSPGVVAALTAGTYTGQVTVTSAAGTQQIPVTLTVSSSPVLLENCVCALHYLSGSANPSATAYLSSSDGSPFTVAASSTASWLSLVAAGSSIGITANTSGLSTGLYAGGVTVTTTSGGPYANIPLMIPVSLLVNGGISAGLLTFSPAALTFTPQAGGQTVNGTISILAATPTAFALSSTPASGTSWLTVIPTSNSTPTTATVQVNPAGLTAGQTYYGTLNFTTAGGTQAVSVAAVVGGATLTAAPASLPLTAPAGGAATVPSPVAVSATSGGSLGFSVTTSDAWLQVSQNSGTTPATINVTANPAGLSVGSYSGTVTFTPTGGGAPATVSVGFSVVAPAVSASSANLTFTYQAGSSTPAAQSVTISGGDFTATAASAGNWLSVSPSSGAAGTSISVSVNPAGLGIGSHGGTVTIAGANGAAGSVTINVTLTVTAALPTITAVLNAASYAEGPISAGEALYIAGTDLGPATLLTGQVTSAGQLASELGGVQVLVNGFPAPLLYASATQVAAIVPYEVAAFGSASVSVRYLGQTSNAIGLQVSATAPGIFTQNQQGTGPAAYNVGGSPNGPTNPVQRNGFVSLFLTGEGITTPPGVTGTINPLNSLASIPKPVAPVMVVLDGETLPSSAIQYEGGVPGTVEGILQVNVQIPANSPLGNVPVTVIVGGNSSQPGVTVSIQ